jgi:hypothetical protein
MEAKDEDAGRKKEEVKMVKSPREVRTRIGYQEGGEG